MVLTFNSSVYISVSGALIQINSGPNEPLCCSRARFDATLKRFGVALQKEVTLDSYPLAYKLIQLLTRLAPTDTSF